MTIAYTLNVLLFAFALLTGLWAFWMAAWLLNRRRVELAASACAKGILGNFFLGLIPFAVLLGIAAGLGQIGGIGLLASLLLDVFILCFAQTGVAGLALLLGERSYQGQALPEPWRVMSRGSSILALTFLIPVLGWVAFLLGSAVVGTGANIRALLSSRRGRKQAQSEPTLAAAPLPSTVAYAE